MSISKEKITTIYPKTYGSKACDLVNKYAGLHTDKVYHGYETTYLVVKY